MTNSTKLSTGKHIPHIFHVIPSFAHGGVPIRIATLINYFGSRSRHTLLSTDNIYTCVSRLNEDVNFEIPHIGDAGNGNILKRMGYNVEYVTAG